jgi:hypothetical protein
MSSLMLVLVLQTATTQFLVSTKAGLVNYVQGPTSVKPATVVQQGQIVQSGQSGAVEILLNPGSYLRMGEKLQSRSRYRGSVRYLRSPHRRIHGHNGKRL